MAQSSNNLDKHILIIDDDIYASEMYSISLKDAGYQVDITRDGDSGYKMMQQNHYDVVLLDIMLPRVNGELVLEKWRNNHPKGTKPPIIIMTNYEQSEAAKAPIVSSSDYYAIKASITPSELRNLIARALEI